MTTPHDNPDEWIADLVDGTAESASSAVADISAPHLSEGWSPGEWQGDDDAIPADDERPADAETVSRAVLELCSHQPQNDVGNGQRLLLHFGDDLLHVRASGWHAWTGTHWRREGGASAATLRAQKTAARIVLEADVMGATPLEQGVIDAARDAQRDLIALARNKELSDAQKVQKKELEALIEAGAEVMGQIKGRKIARRKYAVSSGNSGKIRGMLDQAEPHRDVEIGDLDPDKLALNVENGTLHFVFDEVPDPDAGANSTATIKQYRVVIRPHDRAANITKVAPVIYDPAARCPNFDVAVNRFQPIEAVRSFLQRYHGYAITGLTGEQCLVFNYGTGSNWKSTFVEIVSRIMGDYCSTIGFESIAGDAQRSGSQASPDIARLPGSRLVRASEPERGVQFKEALVKSLTGGEPMLTRHNFGDFFEFRPDFKLVLSGNHKPEIGGVDHGIWRRIKFVPWPVTIKDVEKRPMDDVMRELWAERAGILNWLIAGTIDYLNNGLQTPQEVVDATAAYREEMDPVGSFVHDCVVSVPANADGSPVSTVSAREMYDAFDAWGYANGIKPWKEKGFATNMSQKGFAKERRNNGRVYLHVKLDNVPRARRTRGNGETPPHPADEAVPF